MKLTLPLSAAVAFLLLLPQNARAPPDADPPPPDDLLDSDGGIPDESGDAEVLQFTDPDCAQRLESGWIRVHSDTSDCSHQLLVSNVRLVVQRGGTVETQSYRGRHLGGLVQVEWESTGGQVDVYRLADSYGVSIKPVDDTGSAILEVFPNGKTVITARARSLEVTAPDGTTVNVEEGDLVAFYRGYLYYSIKRGVPTEYDLPPEAFGTGCHCGSSGNGDNSFPFILFVAAFLVGSRRRRRRR